MNYTDSQKTIQYIVLSSVLAAFIAVGAWLRIELPFSPVPITLQTLFVLLAGILLPPAWASASLALYLFAGIIGLPVFAGGTGGFAVIMGPSGGFLIGFFFAALVVSLLSGYGRKQIHRQKDKQKDQQADQQTTRTVRLPALFFIDIGALIVGTLIIYAWGYPWIINVLEWDWRLGLARAVVPYLPGDILKIIAAALLTVPARRIILRNV
ncbi:MAG: biotin transporter BioY [Salinispira sp.]